MDEYKQFYYSARPSAQGKAFGRLVLFPVLLCEVSHKDGWRRFTPAGFTAEKQAEIFAKQKLFKYTPKICAQRARDALLWGCQSFKLKVWSSFYTHVQTENINEICTFYMLNLFY